MLRTAAAAFAGVGEERVTASHQPGRAPLLGGAAQGLHASISHTRGLVAAGVARAAPIGVDVEALRELPAAGLAARWLREEEAAWVAGLSAQERPAGFLRAWVLKEAIAKARGTGMARGGLRQPVPLDDPTGGRVDLRPVPGSPATLAARLGAPVGFVAALALVVEALPDASARTIVEVRELPSARAHTSTTPSMGTTGSVSAS